MNMQLTSTTIFKTMGVGFPYKGGIHYLHPDQIIRLEADSNYTYIFIHNQRPLIMAKVLSEYEALLEPFGFIRIHRSHLVNKHHIARVGLHHVVMDDQSEAGISRRKRKVVSQVLTRAYQAA